MNTVLPSWTAQLRDDLNKMAESLTASLTGWTGPSLIVTPEDCGGSIQAAIDLAHAQGGGTVLLSKGDYVSHSITLRSNISV